MQSLSINSVFLKNTEHSSSKKCIADSLACHAIVWRFDTFLQQCKTFASENDHTAKSVILAINALGKM